MPFVTVICLSVTGGLLEYVTGHSDSSPDTTSWTDAVNQVKRENAGAGQLTKERQDADSKVGDNTGVDTRDVVYGYSVGGSGGINAVRLSSLTYPQGQKI